MSHLRPLPRRLLAARLLLGVLAVTGGAIGGWAVAAPAAFYRDFPGFGRHWLPPLGPFNEHLVLDFGALNLGLAAATLVAAVALTRSAVVSAALGWIVYSAPHLAFHVDYRQALGAADDVAVLVVLGTAAVAAVLALWLVVSGPSGQPLDADAHGSPAAANARSSTTAVWRDSSSGSTHPGPPESTDDTSSTITW